MHLFRRLGETTLVWLAATSGSLLFLLLGPYSNYAPAGFLDPWFYTGYFTNFSYLVRHIGPTYFVSRLPWILPGVAAFRIAPPAAASVLLNLAIVAVSVVSLYWTVRRPYGPAPAVAACVLLAANPYFMCTVSWDYPDGPAIAYGLAALAFATRTEGSRARNSALTGIFLALSGLTNMSGGPMILGVAAIPWLRRRAPARELWREYGWLAAGCALAVLALCPVSQLLFGRWTYFYWQIFQTISAFGNSGFLEKMWGTGGGFLLYAYRLFAPALLLALAPLFLRARKSGRLAWAVYFSVLIAAALYTVQEFVLHGAALRVWYHSSYLLAPLFVLTGFLLGERGISWREAAIACLAAVAIAFYLRSASAPASPWLLLAIFGTTTAGAFLLPRVPLAASLLAVTLALGPGLDQSCQYAFDRELPGQGRNVEVFRNLMMLENGVQSRLDPARRVRFWFDADEPPAPFFHSAESLYLWMHQDFTRDLAAWPEEKLREMVRPNVTFVHLTLDPSRLSARMQLLAARGIRVGNQRRWAMPYRGGTLWVVLQDVAGD
jgi:hypothetical protein